MAGAQIATGTVKTPGQFSGDAAGNALVTMPKVASESGYARLLGEVDAGNVTGNAFLLPPEVSEDFRMRAELDSLLDTEKFVTAVQNTSKHIYRNTTMTAAWTATGLVTNSGNITTTATSVLIQTRQYFPVFGGAQTYAYFPMIFTGTWGVTNKVIDAGFFTAGTAHPYAPTDGVFIRASSAGLSGVMSIGGAETTTQPFKVVSGGADFAPTIGTAYDFIVTAGNDALVFWCDLRNGNGYTQMGRILDAAGSGVTFLQQSLPFSVRDANTGTTSAAQGVRIPIYTITQGGFATNRPWDHTMVASGAVAAQGQTGGTQGANGNYTNNLASGAGVALANGSTAATGLTVQVGVQPTLAVGTDGILASFQVPVPSTTISGKTFLATGVRLRGAVTTVLAGNATPVVYVATLGFGHTSASRGTAEAATTKAPRVVFLGMDTYAAAAAVGTVGQDISMTFPTPQPVNPGEFVDIALKNVGVVTTSGVITYVATIFGYYLS
jgi:hypothetical protein